MSGVLSEIVAHKLVEVGERKRITPQSVLKENLQPGDGSFFRSLSGSGQKLIAEIKPSSPSKGVLMETLDLDRIIDIYCRYASAISVLTDYKYFKGSTELLGAVARISSCPVLCKDFILDTYQVYEARLAGAQAVLLIVKILEDEQLAELHRLVLELGMTPIVEIQNELELERSLVVSPAVLLINNRNLDTLLVDLETTRQLAPFVPPKVIAISASGIERRADIEELLPFCSRFLIGSVLMQSHNLEAKLKELLDK